ncbi:hypothetical protein HYPSUDRAFT_212595 [Hypholoma sublateritium FD-334 SS-4]|uniref:Uncharacterized protein n=1 Tax=Hypholoma sublateritium (strain FD-334 SS-4) TaxID=945553 RepID=A0A0D2PFX1_HYPSF|nr:hypothetical protein HYPSUDRAFT_212595 [Hypholoma sublateritium FD-334 SS-4]
MLHRGFSAWIVSEDEELKEELTELNEEANMISCWIPGRPGKRFHVWWQDHDGGIDTCAFITIDGLCVPGRFLKGTGISVRSGVRTSDNTERPFMFREACDDGLTAEGIPGDAGSITLKIKRVKILEAEWARPLPKLPSPALGKRKRGGASVQLGPEEQAHIRQPTTYKVAAHEEWLPTGSKPITYVTFVFRYKSPESLLRMPGVLSAPAFSKELLKSFHGPDGKIDYSKVVSAVVGACQDHLSKRQKVERFPSVNFSQFNASSSGVKTESSSGPSQMLAITAPTSGLAHLPTAPPTAMTGSRKTSKRRKTSTRTAKVVSEPAPSHAIASTSRVLSSSSDSWVVHESTANGASTSNSRATSSSWTAEFGPSYPSAGEKWAASWAAEFSAAASTLESYSDQDQSFTPLLRSSLMNAGLPDDSGTSESPGDADQEPFA